VQFLPWETWQALERLVDEGQCKAIGLSNVNLEKLQAIVEAARIKPAVVEVKSHPYLPERDLLEYCRRHGIVLLAFAALGHRMEPRLLDHPVIIAIARRVRKTPAQGQEENKAHHARPLEAVLGRERKGGFGAIDREEQTFIDRATERLLATEAV